MHNNYRIFEKDYKFRTNFYKRHELSKKAVKFNNQNDCKIFKGNCEVNREKTCLKLITIPRRINRQDKQMSSEQMLLIEKDYKTISSVVDRLNSSSSRTTKKRNRFYLEGLYLNIEDHRFIINGYDYFNFERITFDLKTYLDTTGGAR